jgi:hypothetical protein
MKKNLKTYKLYWADTINKSITIKAHSKKEAKKLFHNGNIDFTMEQEGDINYLDDSLEIEEDEN